VVGARWSRAVSAFASKSRFGLSVWFWTAAVAGRVDWLRSRPVCADAQRAVDTHLGGLTSERERRMIVRRWTETRRRGGLVDIWLKQRNFAHGPQVVQIDGLEHLDAALARGGGAIIASTHFGYPRLIKPLLSLHGQPAHLVGVPKYLSSEPYAEDLPTGLNLRPLLAALKRNEPVIILIDGRASKAFHPTTVVGIELPIATGVMNIARSVGVPVLPAFLRDDSSLRKPLSLRLVIHPALEIQRTGEPALDLEENTRRFTRIYENEIRAHPHNFPWIMVRDGKMVSPTQAEAQPVPAREQ
jgi:lauroyl/myristoyl acyltransferase